MNTFDKIGESLFKNLPKQETKMTTKLQAATRLKAMQVNAATRLIASEPFKGPDGWTTLQVEQDSKEVAKSLNYWMGLTAKWAAKRLQVDDTSVPAGPDTSKFSAQKSGKVELSTNVTIHGDYGFSTVYKTFVKIGGAISSADQDKIVKDLIKRINLRWKIKSLPCVFKTSDGYDIMVQRIYGTNWGGIGWRAKRTEG